MAHVIPSQGDRLSQLEEIVKTLVDRVDTIRKDLDELRSALL
jgi:hypothetical protein